MGTNATGCTEWERDFDPETEQPKGDQMDAPLCKICGNRHWERMCPVTKAVTAPVTKAVTKAVDVTPAVTCPECAKLRREVVRLTALLVEAADLKPRKPLAMTGAERVKKLRAKRKAGGSP